MSNGAEHANHRTKDTETEGYRPDRLPQTLRLIQRAGTVEASFRFGSGAVPDTVVPRGGFRAVGLRWEGTFAEAGQGAIRPLQAQMIARIGEVSDAIEADTLVCVSFTREGGFVHYIAVQVREDAPVPEGMHDFSLETANYLYCRKGETDAVEDVYAHAFSLMGERGFAHDRGIHVELHSRGWLADRPYAMDIYLPVVPL
ncbi:GyrI-like domain-containing protein [Paenibacillus xanthanilyticus]|uniref:GyrI-like domain-containing protein n=1 Tax=Paenibacillus xanthanilyticus TaxID=1783531 RepID=A0ABV8KBK3_9BACL